MSKDSIGIKASILCKDTFVYIKQYMQGMNSGDSIAVYLGNLAYIFNSTDSDVKRLKKFINNVIDIVPFIDKYISKHISDFFDTTFVCNQELIDYYIMRLNNIKIITDEDNLSLLYSSVMRAAYKSHRDINRLLGTIRFFWRSFYELSNIYFYYNNKTMALNYIIKAIKVCPEDLKYEFVKRKEYILSQI